MTFITFRCDIGNNNIIDKCRRVCYNIYKVSRRKFLNMKPRNTDPLKISGIILTALGLIFMIAGLFVLAIGIKNTTSNIEVDAVITRVDKFYEDVYVDYEVDGELYTDMKLNSYSSSMREGDHVEIFVDPEKPYDIKAGNEMLIIGGVFSGVGFIITVVGVILLFKSAGKKALEKRLIEDGYYIEAKYDYTDVTGVRINSRPTYVVRCSYLNPEDGNIYSFKSRYFTYDPSMYINSETIRVYVDRNDFKKNYVDLSYITDKYIEC